MKEELTEVIIPAEQIDSKQYFYPSGDEITDTKRKIGVWLKWHHFGLVSFFVDMLKGKERDAHERLVSFFYDQNNHVYKVLVS